MWFWLVVAGIGGAVLIVAWASPRTAPIHAKFTSSDVEAAMLEIVSPETRYLDGWDDFLSFPIDDPYLESIRQRCLTICRNDPPAPGRELSEEAIDQVKLLLNELRSR